MYQATITIPDKSVDVLFRSQEFSSERVKVEQTLTNSGVQFTIDAQDSVALRAVCNSITKLLTVWEKTGKL